MGDDKDWQKQLLGAALMAAARTAIQYVTNPETRDETVNEVKSRLADVDYTAAARAVSDVIDRLAETSKEALNEAIDSIRLNAADAVEAAAEKAQEQLGAPRKRRRGRLFLGIMLGMALGFVLLNEDRRNRLMDKLTGASGPVDSSQWSTIASNAQEKAGTAAAAATETAPQAVEAAHEVASKAEESAQQVASEAVDQAQATAGKAKEETKKGKAAGNAKKDDEPES